MSDQPPGSPSPQPDDAAAGSGGAGASPFSREHAADPPGSGYTGDGAPGTDQPSGSGSGERPPSPYSASAWQPPTGPGPQPAPPAPAYPGQPVPPYGVPYAEPAPQPGPQPSAPGYGPGYGTPGPGIGGADLAPYAGSYGGWSDYGAAPVQHPQATAALVTGILAAVFGVVVGIGGLIGIVSVVLGVKVRRAIDRDPARYTGRGYGTAGLVLGIVSILAMLLWILLFMVAVVVSSSS